MKFTYNGHNYQFKDNILIDSTGLKVAKIELASDSNYDEYNYFIDLVSGEVMHSEHENTVLFDKNYIYLAGQYEAFNN